MAPRPTGEVIERQRERGRVFALRFRASGGAIVTLGAGTKAGRGRRPRLSCARARRVSVALGARRRPEAEGPKSPTFHEFASEWLAARRANCARRRSPTTHGSSATTCCRSSPPTGFRRSRSRRSTAIARSRSASGALGRVDQQDDHAPRADPRLGGGARPHVRNPVRVNTRNASSRRSGTTRLPRLGRADRRDDRRRHRARCEAGGTYGRPARADRDARLRRPEDRRGDRADSGRTSTSPTAASPSAREDRRRHPPGRHPPGAPRRAHEPPPAHAGAAPTDLVFPTSTGSRRDKDNARERVIRPVSRADELLARRGRRRCRRA